MNTQSITFTSPRIRKETRRVELNHREHVARFVRWSVAGTSALTVILAGIWAATSPAMTQYFHASLWAAGFLFFALALEVNIKRIMPFITTGLVLPVLALLGSRVAEEFSILAVAIIAGWLAIGIGKRS